MNLLKYPKRISKETNIAFIAMWVISIICQANDKRLWDWRIAVLNAFMIIISYLLMIVVIKKNIWDKRK